MSNVPLRPGLANAKITVDVVIFTIQDNAVKVLLVQRSEMPHQGEWALPGGFLWETETANDAARRVLHDKAGVENVFVEQLYTFDALDRDPRNRVISITHYALIPREQLDIAESETTESPTFHLAVAGSKLAFDHGQIIDYALRRLRAKLGYTNAAYSLLPKHFTLTELQQLYETVYGRTLDKRNFRKKFLSLGLIEPTNDYSSGGRHRPAQLYRFVSTEPMELTQGGI